jgi:hypothetical protein
MPLTVRKSFGGWKKVREMRLSINGYFNPFGILGIYAKTRSHFYPQISRIAQMIYF